MRLFTENENKLIEDIVATKSEGISAIQNLQAAKIFRNKFKFFGLKWTSGDCPSISIYFRKSDDEENKHIFNTIYYQVVDFIYFIKELESYGFIAIQTLSSNKKREYSLLYDRENYIYNEKDNEFYPKNKSIIDLNEDTKPLIFEKVSHGISILFQVNHQDINLDFANDLERYGLGIIYPLPLAVDYVKNKFKTLERIQYEQDITTALDSAESSRKAAKYGMIAAWFGIGSFIIAVITLLLSHCSNTKLSYENAKAIERIKSAIKSNYVTEPVEITTLDTMIVKEMKIQPSKPQNNE